MQWRKHILRLLLILFCLGRGINGFASHIFGGELLYTCINDTTYKLSLTFYGDCSAFSPIFHSLDGATPLIYIYNNGAFFDTVRLHPDTIEVDVSPVCSGDIDSTTCHSGTLPGVKKFVYLDTVIIPAASIKWSFIFKGDMGSSNAAGRSYNISNIFSPGTSLIQLEADLNNITGNNSNPQYSTIPTPFYCVNYYEQYNQGAVDPDGDSLTFKMVPAYNGATGSTVTYLAPYTATSPMATNPGNFNFYDVNGELAFTPNITQDALIVTQVAEYRGNVQVGSSEREMTFIIIDNCTGTPPTLHISSIYGGLPENNIINICLGTPQLSFILALTNPDGDSTRLTYNNLPAGAVLDTFDNNTPNPSASFSWNTSAIPAGIYTFYMTVKNNHCPISNTSTIAYTINIATPPTVAVSQVSPTDCIHQAQMQYTMTDGFLPRYLYVVNSSGDTIKSYTDTTAAITDSLPVGSYTVIVTSDSLCTAYDTFTITDSGTIPLSPLTISLCVDDATGPVSFLPVAAAATINWFTANGTPLTAPPTPNTNYPNTGTWYVTENYKVCASLPDTVKAIVRTLPVPQVQLPATICFGDTIQLVADGDAKYTWSPTDEILINSNNELYFVALQPRTFTVTAVDAYGCTDTVTVPYTDVQPCCNFSYPNAFTPNNDGRNDGWRVLTYGNMQRYWLSIYNRWGDRVFFTETPGAYWDGTHDGKECDPDTYYYYFKGQCLTGRSEEHKGNITLIR